MPSAATDPNFVNRGRASPLLPGSIGQALIMKYPNAALSLLFAAMTALAIARPAHATDVNGCWWTPNFPGPAHIVFNVPVTLHVAQDAPVGTVVGGQDFLGIGDLTPPKLSYTCQNNRAGGPLVPVDYNAINTAPIAQLANGVPRIAMPVPETDIMATNIPGLGVSVLVRGEVDGTSPNEPLFIVQKSEARVPFHSTRHHYHETIMTVSAHRYTVTLIKTGPIPPGRHTLDPGNEIFRSVLTQSVPGVTDALYFALGGELVVPGCSTAPNPVTPNPVDLGEFDVKDFDQAGAGTNPVRFDLNLENCAAPGQGALPRVHLQLDPTNGSTTLDAANGLFSLGSGSAGEGVAFQMLRQDGLQAMPLETKVPILTLANGDMKLPLNVHLVKHGGAVKPGALAGALNFLLTYE